MREVAATFENPCMFCSIGKDSTVMLHRARKAFIRSGSVVYNDQMETQALKQAPDHDRFDTALGGARRDKKADPRYCYIRNP